MKKIFAAHHDTEASKAAHPFWYRFGGDVLWFTFDSVEAVPEKCWCGEKFYLPPEQPNEAAKARATEGEAT